jgi:mannosyltransferase OCH1-like enzyme
MIPKTVHFSWIDDSILMSNHIFPRNTIQKMIELSPDWKFKLNINSDIEDFLETRLDKSDYKLIKDCHIVEKSDIWRLMKLYEEGGVYTDIDRLCNISFDDIISNDIMCVLPICADNNFSQDFMCSAPYNPIFIETFKLIMSRRKEGYKNTYFLGPQTYMHAVTKVFFGNMIDVNPGKDIFNEIKNQLSRIAFIKIHQEYPPYDTIIYRPKTKLVDFNHEEMKRDFYANSKIKHWTGEW